jgi:hypothetical protein
LRTGLGQGGERRELGFQLHVEPASTAVRDVHGANGFGALVTYPWVVSGGCAAGERRAHAAEIEHGKGDECFG